MGSPSISISWPWSVSINRSWSWTYYLYPQGHCQHIWSDLGFTQGKLSTLRVTVCIYELTLALIQDIYLHHRFTVYLWPWPYPKTSTPKGHCLYIWRDLKIFTPHNWPLSHSLHTHDPDLNTSPTHLPHTHTHLTLTLLSHLLHTHLTLTYSHMYLTHLTLTYTTLHSWPWPHSHIYQTITSTSHTPDHDFTLTSTLPCHVTWP